MTPETLEGKKANIFVNLKKTHIRSMDWEGSATIKRVITEQPDRIFAEVDFDVSFSNRLYERWIMKSTIIH